MTERFVPTAAIRQAIAGREEEVLDGLGIPWRSGRPHIRCPYPYHADNDPSWRWDAVTRKGFCSCTRGDNVLDVIAKVEGCDFEAAKLRAAEILNRHDLIRARSQGGGSGQRYQATDAASLLSAPASDRDDALPVAYLARRLGVPVTDVPVPCTPMVGLKALGYYDAPAPGSKGKPKLVGVFPCAVFGTVAADGGTHAHRIYLAPGGAGKADLGNAPDGRPRDAKKSAKKTGEEDTAGRSVLWGDAAAVPHIIISEGIETGAAVALAMAPEIEAGTVAVAAAISAPGLEAFQPYPVTQRVTVAADRDEAAKADGRPGSRRGERAARTFALKHHQAIPVAIALAGAPGTSVDWLDILNSEGVDAVRAGLLAPQPFVPTEHELEERSRERLRAAELQAIAATFPLPEMETLRLVYRRTGGGRVMVHRVVAGADGPEYVPVATPFGTVARLRHLDQADAYGLRCLVRDMTGEPRAVDFDRATLARMAAAEVKAALFAAGLRVEADGDVVAIQCLKAADPHTEIVVVRRPGWHEIPGYAEPVFLGPDGSVLGAPDGVALELSAAARMQPEVAAGGMLENWQQAIAAALSISGCPHWTLGVAAAFVGPLIALTGLDTCGINLSGMSSSGKSTAQRLAASAWSSPDIRKPGLMQSARATDNAIEALAQRATGTVLALDELAHIGGKVAGKVIYTIAGGVGKRRMSADASLRDGYTWATFAILSGETSLEEKIRADGEDYLAGMAVRIVDVDVTDTDRGVDAGTLKRINDIEQHYGHAGPAFVRKLIANGLHRQAGALRERVLTAGRRIAGEGADGALIRAATPLALLLIAGELAKVFALIPGSAAVGDAAIWAWARFRRSSDATALDPETQAIDAIRGWISERWDVSVKNVDAGTGTNSREAVAWYDHNAVYIPKTRLREAAGNRLRESHVASIIERRGMLARRTESDRLYVRFVPRVGRVVSYALRRSEFGRSEYASDPEAFECHEGGRHG